MRTVFLKPLNLPQSILSRRRSHVNINHCINSLVPPNCVAMARRRGKTIAENPLHSSDIQYWGTLEYWINTNRWPAHLIIPAGPLKITVLTQTAMAPRDPARMRETGMSKISEDDRDYVNSRRRDAAIVIDEAEQALPIRERDGSF